MVIILYFLARKKVYQNCLTLKLLNSYDMDKKDEGNVATVEEVLSDISFA